MNKIYAIIGPTAVGKTKLAIELAQKTGGEIINFDSMQVYRMLDIGTAKPNADELAMAKHHMIDIVDPKTDYNVVAYQRECRELIANIHSQGKPAILVGGTGLYLNSVIYDIEFSKESPDTALRDQFEALLAEKGAEHLHALLQTVDPANASKIHKNNTRRVIRALEIYYSTGNAKNDYRGNLSPMEAYDVTLIGLKMNRLKLYARINKRVDQMMDQGLVEEIKNLKNIGLDDTFNSMKGIGYKEVLPYLDGKYDYETMVSLIKQNTRRYAKRQITWLNMYKDITMIDMDNFNEVDQLINNI